ncbi:hypothetical protein [Geoalkalibacter halelectricus]|uniref:hypothetical protein n=1 Tax=Geoalkalibacter halelectricus TaxID=2847045 RepID=UPI003D20747A
MFRVDDRRLFCLIPVFFLFPEQAAAHAFPERLDPHMPFTWYLAGAAVAVILSFICAACSMRSVDTALHKSTFLVPSQLERTLHHGGRIFGVLALLALLIVGILGPQEHWERNLLPVTIWVYFWVMLLLGCALIGNVFSVINPLATLGRILAREPHGTITSAWPAAGFLLCFAWAELIWTHNTNPQALAILISAYMLLTMLAMRCFGAEAWLRHGEVFHVVFSLAGRMAPLSTSHQSGRKVLVLRPPGSGLFTGGPSDHGRVAVILILLAMVSFDGYSETLAWSSLSGGIMHVLFQLGVVSSLGYTTAGAMAKTLGLVSAIVLVSSAFLVAVGLVAFLERRALGEAVCAYAPSLVPIAIGYHLAHYFSYILIEGQLILSIASDPLGLGWNLFGTAGHTANILDLNMQVIWITALVGVVGGHVLGILTAQRIALRRAASPNEATIHHLPLVVLMVCYTVFSLWSLSQPILEH